MGFSKKPEAGPGFFHTRPGLDTFKYKITKNPIYIYKLTKTLAPLIFHTQPPSISLTASLSSPSLTHGLNLMF